MRFLPEPSDYSGSGRCPIWDGRIDNVTGTFDGLSLFELRMGTEKWIMNGKIRLLNNIQWNGDYGAAISENGLKIFFKKDG